LSHLCYARSFSSHKRRRRRGTRSAYAVGMSWIDQLIRHLEQVTCSGCGEYYRGGDIAAVVTEPSRLIVRLRCRACGQDGIAILDFGVAPVVVEPITADEVLDCHDLLAGAARPPSALFPAIAA
jgi:RNase P subunit RPR2